MRKHTKFGKVQPPTTKKPKKKTKPKNILRRRGGSRPDAGIPRPRRWRIGGRNVTLKS